MTTLLMKLPATLFATAIVIPTLLIVTAFGCLVYVICEVVR